MKLSNTLVALHITAENNPDEVKKLRDENTTFLIHGKLYTFKPNRCCSTPVKLSECRFGERCNRKTTCKFYHSNQDRRLRAVITADSSHEDHLRTILRGVEPSPRGRLIDFVVYLPYTETLYKIVKDHEEYLEKRLKAEGLWKTITCQRTTQHDAASCRFWHEGEVVSQDETQLGWDFASYSGEDSIE